MHRGIALAAVLVACKPPPSCVQACEIVVGECGLGGDMDLCVDGCRATPLDDLERHDVRDCLAAADCGHLAAGECVGTARCGPAYYVVASAGCLDGTRAVHVARDCTIVAENADWGALGPPHAGDDGAITFAGTCVRDVEAHGDQGHCTTPAGDTCDYLVWPVL